MSYILERFEDAGLAVLETDTGDSQIVSRGELPTEVREGDVLIKLPWYHPGAFATASIGRARPHAVARANAYAPRCPPFKMKGT